MNNSFFFCIKLFITLFFSFLFSQFVVGQSNQEVLLQKLEVAQSINNNAGIDTLLHSLVWAEEQQMDTLDFPFDKIYRHLAILHFLKGLDAPALKWVNKAIAVRKQQTAKIPQDLARNHFLKAVIQQELGEFEAAQENISIDINTYETYRQELPIKEEQHRIDSILSFMYKENSKVLKNLGDYHTQQVYLNKALLFSETNQDLYDTAEIYMLLGISYENQANFTLGDEYYQKAIDKILEFDTSGSDLLRLIYTNQGVSLLKQERYQESINYSKKALSLYKKQKGDENNNVLIEIANLHANLLQAYIGLQATAKIQYHFEQGVAILEQKIKNPHHQTLAELYRLKASWELEQKKYQQALQMVQATCKILLPFFRPKDVLSNPIIANNTINNKLELAKVLNIKARVLKILGKEGGRTDDLLRALSTSETLDTLLVQVRQSYQELGSHYALIEETLPVFENAIEVCLELYKKTDDKRYFEYAYAFSSKNKALLLWERLQDSKAKKFANVPAELIERERYFKKQIYDLESKQIELVQRPADSLLLLKERSELFDKKRAYQFFIKQLEQDYPTYHALKYSTKLPSLEEIRDQLLDDESALIEYFVGLENIYVFSISKDTQKVEVLQKTIDFEQKVSDFHQTLSQQGTYSAYVEQAHVFYQTYLEESISSLAPSIKRLILIPDDKFNLLPFEALLMKKVNSSAPIYSNLPFLIHRYQITYAYSGGTQLLTSIRTEEQRLPFIGFAPSFADLFYNKESIVNISKIIGGEIYTDDEATKSRLINNQEDLKILHLSTHAQMDDEHPHKSKIELADEPVTIAEIYNIPFQTELAVLSACETGTGQIRKGEGMMSLGRAFMYSGCPSVVSSLWKVEDQTTATLMENFYYHLKQGLDKDAALHQAKLDFLQEQTQDALSNPYYWAAFIHIGDTEAITFSSLNICYIILVSVLLVMLLVGGGYLYTAKQRIFTKQNN